MATLLPWSANQGKFIIQAKKTEKHVFLICEKYIFLNLWFNLSRNLRIMAKPFFEDNWESSSLEEISRARARLAGFIEATPDKEKLLREVSSII